MTTEIRKLGQNDLQFATGGTTAEETVASTEGKTVTKIDATHIKLRSMAKTVEAVISQLDGMIVFVIDGGGSAIATGIKGDIVMPCGGTFTVVSLLADQSGSIVVDIWKDTYANFPPTDADSMTAGGTPPTITTATKSQDSTMASWASKTFAAGDVLRFNVDSCTTIQRCTVAIKFTKAIP